MKLPLVNQQTKLLCFDLETNGLHGQAFAAGGLVMSADGVPLHEYSARMELAEPVDDWVAENVLPNISDMAITHTSYDEFCNDFWEWLVAAKSTADYVIVQNGYPVEYRFLLQCQEQDIDSRYWEHPFPILDLTSLLVQAGYDEAAKVRLQGRILNENKMSKHHPMHDARVTALVAFEVLLDRFR